MCYPKALVCHHGILCPASSKATSLDSINIFLFFTSQPFPCRGALLSYSLLLQLLVPCIDSRVQREISFGMQQKRLLRNNSEDGKANTLLIFCHHPRQVVLLSANLQHPVPRLKLRMILVAAIMSQKPQDFQVIYGKSGHVMSIDLDYCSPFQWHYFTGSS